MTFYEFGKAIVPPFVNLFNRLTVRFEAPLEENKGFIVACNHVSDLDPVMLGISFPKPVYFMAKRELFQIPVFSAIIKGLGAFPVERGKADTGALSRAEEIIKSGEVLGIFPEGKRSMDGSFGRVKSGTVVIASQTGADIVPAAIIYGKRKLFHRRQVTLRFGKPIRYEELHIIERNRAELRNANIILETRMVSLLEEGL